MGRYIKLENNKVISIRQGIEIVPGEIESENGELGQLMQLDGTFIDDPVTEPCPYNPTNAEVAQLVSDLEVKLIIAGVI